MAGEERLAAALGALLHAQGIPVSSERAARLAAALAPLVEASARERADDPPDFAAVMEAQRWRR